MIDIAKIAIVSLTASTLLFSLSSPRPANSGEWGAPVIGTTVVLPSSAISPPVFDRAKTGIWSSFTAQKLALAPDTPYVVIETKPHTGLIGSETWLALSPVVDGKTDYSSKTWMKYLENHKITNDYKMVVPQLPDAS